MSGRPCTTTATAQGYLPAHERPQCGNCLMGKAPASTPVHPGLLACQHGGFAVAADGWCTVWLPVRRWLEVNGDAAARLGLGLGADL